MSLSRFIDRLESHSHLDHEDVRCLRDLAHEKRSIASGSFIIRNGAGAEQCSLLNSGVIFGHKIAGNGSRQILSLFFAGELIDFDGLLLRTFDHNLEAKSRCELTVFNCEEFVNLIFLRPAIGKAVMREASIKAAISREWMMNIGRRDSSTKVAHFLCEMSLRLAQDRDGGDREFALPITQEQIGDVLGITPMHVGRVLKDLAAEGLIERNKRVINIPNWKRLKIVGDFSPEYLEIGAAHPTA